AAGRGRIASSSATSASAVSAAASAPAGETAHGRRRALEEQPEPAQQAKHAGHRLPRRHHRIRKLLGAASGRNRDIDLFLPRLDQHVALRRAVAFFNAEYFEQHLAIVAVLARGYAP